MAPTTATQTVRVLLADDQPLFREGVQSALATDEAFDVVAGVGTVQDALLEVARLAPDVVVTDLDLPDGSGTTVCERVQAEHPRVRLLVLTRSARPDDVMSALRAGAHGYALKCAGPLEVLSALRSLAVGDTYLDPRIADCVVNVVASGKRARAALGLTRRERDILELVGRGLTVSKIALELGVSVRTAETRLRHLANKLATDDLFDTARTVLGRSRG